MMPFQFGWMDADRHVMTYVAEGIWNWNDYHQCVRASLFSMHQHPHPVHSLIDLRASTRATLPSGLAAHVRTFGKRLSPALSGQVVVVGMPADGLLALAVTDGRYATIDGTAYFVATLEDALMLLNGF